MAFENLSNKLQEVFKGLRGKGVLTEADVKAAIEKLKTTVAGGDTEAIKADCEAVEKAFYAISEKLYAAQQGAQGAGPDMGGAQGGDNSYYNADFDDKTNN